MSRKEEKLQGKFHDDEIRNGSRRVAYPVYVGLTKKSSRIIVPDFNLNDESDVVMTMAGAIEKARAMIENAAKEMEDAGKTIPAINSVEYKKNRGEVLTYVDVNLDRLMRKRKTLEELEEEQAGMINTMWDVKENVLEFLLNQKVMSVTLTQRKFIKKVKEYAEKYPDEVRIERENNDGSIFAKLPTSYLRITRPPEGRVISEDEKAVLRERFEKARQKRLENIEKGKLDESSDEILEELEEELEAELDMELSEDISE